MRRFLTSSAMALLLGLGVAGGAQAGQADQPQAGASAQTKDLAAMAPQSLLGKEVVSAKGKVLGEVSEVLEGEGGQRYALIDLPGDATPPAKNLMPLEKLAMKDGKLTWTSEEAEGAKQAAGEIDRSKYKSLAAVLDKDKLRASLKDAGFQSVAVVDAAYLVRATASDGSPVVMMIDPPSSGAGSSQQDDGSTKQASASGQDKLSAALEKAGFRHVAVVDAAYLVRAKTAEGVRSA